MHHLSSGAHRVEGVYEWSERRILRYIIGSGTYENVYMKYSIKISNFARVPKLEVIAARRCKIACLREGWGTLAEEAFSAADELGFLNTYTTNTQGHHAEPAMILVQKSQMAQICLEAQAPRPPIMIRVMIVQAKLFHN